MKVALEDSRISDRTKIKRELKGNLHAESQQSKPPTIKWASRKAIRLYMMGATNPSQVVEDWG